LCFPPQGGGNAIHNEIMRWTMESDVGEIHHATEMINAYKISIIQPEIKRSK
jgi:hypothetical protein